ncbi:MAG TPA: CoA-binding protein, partial [Micromonosporaceae bacterium]|nr:CoA-binding protein [Micromonosporaceae bacterium]
MDALRALWAARSVAVVGASTRAGAPGRLAVEFLNRYGYPGAVLPIHPSAGEIAGRPAYPSLAASPGAELALIVVPAPAVPAAVADCAAAGVRVAIVGTSGFGETGAEGRAAQDALVARARGAGMRLVGPNCIGAVGVATGQVACFSPLFAGASTVLRSGGIGFASTSGALGFGTVSLALERGMGLLAAVTTGNEADVTAVEVLAALAAEPGCTALLGCLESLTDAPALRALAAARQATGRPVALLVAGRSPAGARAAVSHTGVLATPDRVVDCVLRQLGIVRVSDVDELLDVGDAFTLARPPGGPRVAVVTTSGGSGILAADAVAAHGLSLATLAPSTVDILKSVVPPYGAVGNPVDVTATVMRDRTLVSRALAAVAAD